MSTNGNDIISHIDEDINLDDIPEVAASDLSAADERLIRRFQEVETQSIDRLTDGGKRLVEWGTAAIGIFFASLALLENPRVLDAFRSPEARIFGVASIISYLLAIACGFFVSIPMRYRISSKNLTRMEASFQKIFNGKYRLLFGGSLFFVMGSASLGALIILILFAV
jgi:hypothetical protein